MQPIRKLIYSIRRKPRRIQVFALVGKAGTGKSFRARLITEKYGIHLIIDDGLLIRGQRILAGRSAKREKTRVRAVKRAIFYDPDHAQEIRDVLDKESFKSILILGTSDKMIARIVESLDLSYPDKVIYIEDIATEDEILHARESRRRAGKHVIPVPVIEVKKDPAHRILDSIRLFMRTRPLLSNRKKIVEKTVVQTPYSRRGKLSISEAALSQMIMHCVEEFIAGVSIRRLIIEPTPTGYEIEVKLSFPYGVRAPETMAEMQEYIIKHVESYSGIHIEALDLTLEQVRGKEK